MPIGYPGLKIMSIFPSFFISKTIVFKLSHLSSIMLEVIWTVRPMRAIVLLPSIKATISFGVWIFSIDLFIFQLLRIIFPLTGYLFRLQGDPLLFFLRLNIPGFCCLPKTYRFAEYITPSRQFYTRSIHIHGKKHNHPHGQSLPYTRDIDGCWR